MGIFPPFSWLYVWQIRDIRQFCQPDMMIKVAEYDDTMGFMIFHYRFGLVINLSCLSRPRPLICSTNGPLPHFLPFCSRVANLCRSGTSKDSGRSSEVGWPHCSIQHGNLTTMSTDVEGLIQTNTSMTSKSLLQRRLNVSPIVKPSLSQRLMKRWYPPDISPLLRRYLGCCNKAPDKELSHIPSHVPSCP